MISQTDIERALSRVVDVYNAELGVNYREHLPRISFDIFLAVSSNSKPLDQLAICDIGAGIGLFTVGCAALGVRRVILLDDFGDAPLSDIDRNTLALHARCGVEVVTRDVVAQGIDDLAGVDTFTSFQSMEHWHSSPKRLFRQISASLPPGGSFVLCTPNCVNLRKRLTVPFGIGKWTPMEVWYEPDVFRGHVREPDVDDLEYIARDMQLRQVKIYGRNWLGYYSRYAVARWGTRLIDRPLRLIPSLCSDIYMVGTK